MKEINIATTIVAKRRIKGITQDELATYIGVSKASVSKWETGQSYPDITFLPQLAAYFNISIDELMGYAPQMTKEDIRKLYHNLSTAFATQPFELVIQECRSVIKKYYSCFPLLLQMTILLVNHHMMAKEKEEQDDILKQAIGLCVRIREESEDVWISKEAVSMEATCYLMSHQPESVLDLLGETIRPISGDAEMIAQAYQIMGNVQKAKEITQINMYQHLLSLMGATPAYLLLNANEIEKIEEILHRALSLAVIYDLDKLHPNTMAQIYYVAAQVYSMNGNVEKAIDMLQKYTNLCVSEFFPFSLHGDAYFDAIDEWFADFDLGALAPRNEKTIRESMLQGVVANPAFICLKEEARFKTIVAKLKKSLGGN